jgi:hypothetical protein
VKAATPKPTGEGGLCVRERRTHQQRNGSLFEAAAHHECGSRSVRQTGRRNSQMAIGCVQTKKDASVSSLF